MRIATASTIVRKFPTRAPAASSVGRPSLSSATSVVVPPISDTKPRFKFVIHFAPTIDAAGPLRIVSIGFLRASLAEISAPSPRTTIKGASIFRLDRVAPQRPINSSIIPINLALRTAVRARLGPLSFEDN